jgi:hypothetical protein
MTTEPTEPDPDYDTLDAAEDAHVEACTGDQVRAALAPFVPHLRDIHPEGARDLLTGFGATGLDWVSTFRAPTRFGWAGKRYPEGVGRQIADLLIDLIDRQEKTAEAYRATINNPSETP